LAYSPKVANVNSILSSVSRQVPNAPIYQCELKQEERFRIHLKIEGHGLRLDLLEMAEKIYEQFFKS
jgi:hypothetical protein